jgi:hypothetical protein
MTSGGLSQLTAVLCPLGEQIRNPQYGNNVKGLWNMTHRNHLQKLASGR